MSTAIVPRRLEGLRVLVVDDDVPSAEALRELIDEEGAYVHAVNNGQDALAVTDRCDFDVVISDITMPGMDGHALLRALRDNARYASVPAVACSGYSSNADLDLALHSGFAMHLMKPLDMERVVSAILAVTTAPARR